MKSDPAVEAEELDRARREALRARHSAVCGLPRGGVINEERYSLMVGEVDPSLTDENLTWPKLPGESRYLPLNPA